MVPLTEKVLSVRSAGIFLGEKSQPVFPDDKSKSIQEVRPTFLPHWWWQKDIER